MIAPPQETSNVQRELESLRAMVESLKAQIGGAGDIFPRVFVAKSTATGVFAEAVPDSTAATLETPSGLRAGVAGGFSKLLDITSLDANGIFVLEVPFAAGHRYFKISSTSGLIPVQLSGATGSAGTSTTQCAFVYTVKDFTGTTTLGTGIGMTGNGQRNQVGAMSAGSWGFAYKKSDGTYALLWADESESTVLCGSSDGGTP